jgi:hypothetical protein
VSERTRHLLRDALLAVLLFALGLVLSHVTRERSFEVRLNSDEPEWIAISILHWRQFVLGEPPAGADLDSAELARDDPWTRGVQRTTFGYMNPCLPKLVWGGVLAARGFDQASPLVFQVFHKERPEAGRAAQAELLDAAPTARAVVVALSVASAVLLFFTARHLAAGAAGWVAAGAAYVLWFAAPLVQVTSSYIRTDEFMLPFCIAGLWLALARAVPTLACAAWMGVLCGLAVSSKLNGALLGVATVAWVALAAARRDLSLRTALAMLLVAGGIACALFYALNPRLWAEPWTGVADVLARWDKLMAYFQHELAPRMDVAVARSIPERTALFARSLARDLPGGLAGVVLTGGGTLLLTWRALRGSHTLASRTLLAFAAVFIAGTLAWLPLDWERFYLTSLPVLVLLQALPAAAIAERLGRASAQPHAQR